METFFRENNTTLRLRRALKKVSDKRKYSLWKLLNFYLSPEAQLVDFKMPGIFSFFNLMLEHFGRSAKVWNRPCMWLLYVNRRTNNARYKWPLLFVFLSVDDDCIDWEVATRISRMFPAGHADMSLDDDRLRYWAFDTPPESINIKTDVLDRVPENARVSINDVREYLTIFPNRQYPRCVLEKVLTYLPLKTSFFKFEEGRRDVSPVICEALCADATIAFLVPDEFEHWLILHPNVIESIFFDFHTYDDVSIDEILASRLAFLLNPNFIQPIYDHLIEIKEEHQQKLDNELATFYEKNSDQESETHEWVAPGEDHACNLGDHCNTYPACCTNCDSEHRFELYGIKKHRAFVSTCNQLLRFFHKPTMAKRAE